MLSVLVRRLMWVPGLALMHIIANRRYFNVRVPWFSSCPKPLNTPATWEHTCHDLNVTHRCCEPEGCRLRGSCGCTAQSLYSHNGRKMVWTHVCFLIKTWSTHVYFCSFSMIQNMVWSCLIQNGTTEAHGCMMAGQPSSPRPSKLAPRGPCSAARPTSRHAGSRFPVSSTQGFTPPPWLL